MIGGDATVILDDRRCDNVFNVNSEFYLQQRGVHVYSEARRVIQFKTICENGGTIQQLGSLMNESGASCAGDYDCSCTELDQITKLAIQNGAVGSRLTGAGWGGSTVSLVDKKMSILLSKRCMMAFTRIMKELKLLVIRRCICLRRRLRKALRL